MSGYNGFDALDNSFGYQDKNDEPVWKKGFDDEKELHKWLLNEKTQMNNESQERVADVKKHIALYKGLQYFSQEARTSRRDREEVTSKYKQKVVVNHLYDITEQRVARTVKFKPNVAVLPVHDELEDRISAKVAKMTGDHIAHEQRVDMKMQESVRSALITGEAYAFIEWNPDLGPEMKESKEAREAGEEIELEIDGEKVKDRRGKVKKLPKGEVINIGDVEVRIVRPHLVFPERKRNYEDCNFMIRVDLEETDVLKERYPEKKDKIKQDKTKSYFDFTKYEETKLQRETFVYHFYHKRTREVPEGRYVKFTEDAILENRELPYSHGDFPCERLVEIDVPEELHGRSFYIHARHLQAHINNLTSMQMRNQYMAAHPKWFVPQGSVKLESLGNDLTIVQYKGSLPPSLAQSNPTSPETINLRKTLIEEMGQINAVHGTSRGEPPPGVKAGVAMQFLAEQEHERENAFSANYNEFVRRVYAKIISTAADNYEPEEERTIKVLGKDSKWMSEKLDAKHLTKSFDIRIQNSSALPKSQAARTQMIMDLSERFPELFTDEQVLDMLDLGKTDRFFNEGTAAVRSAEDIYDMITEDKDVPDPAEFEFHIPYWKVFSAKMQDHAFRDLPKKIQDTVIEYMGAREMMMVDKAEENPAFAEKLGQLEQFPLVFKINPAPEPLGEPPAPMPPEEPMPEELPPELPPEMMQQPPLPDPQVLGRPALEEENPELPPIEPGVGQVPIA